MSHAAEIDTALTSIAQMAKVPLGQVEEVYRTLVNAGRYTVDTLLGELRWFYGSLGLDEFYFNSTPPALISQHVESLFAGKVLASGRGDVGLLLETNHDGRAMYACRDEHMVAVRVERRIEQRFPGYRIQSYRTRGTTGPDTETHLRLYILAWPSHGNQGSDVGSQDLQSLGDESFLQLVTEETKARYSGLLAEADGSLGPVIKVVDRPDRNTTQFLVAIRRGTTHSYFSAASDVLNSYGVQSVRKNVEQFANGTTIYSIHVSRDIPAETIENIHEDLSLVYVLPRTALTPLFRQGKLSAQQVVYAYSVWKFAHQFLSRYTDEYLTLASAFRDDPARMGLLTQLKHRLSKDTFTEDRIYETIFKHTGLVKDLYADFAQYHYVADDRQTLEYDPAHNPELELRITKEVPSTIDQKVLQAFLAFNRHVLKTNFYKDSKVVLAFRLDSSFLADIDYPDKLHGIFFLVGSEFRGFHLRFREVARGGIRIIRSSSAQAFTTNSDFLFRENYDLAHTQQRKNKDIPEGGSKGTILLSLEYQDKARSAFQKYVDGLLDLMLPNDEIADHLGVPESLFLGPDEGTADLMDWASERAKLRGYPYWKAFTTGKSVSLGGIPHDHYGMTTHSVHQYVLGILGKLGLDEAQVTKLQTGGPDGDLGSNEIKISRDKTVAVVDGSGVLYDPQGIDREELSRLADKRLAVDQFAVKQLSGDGALVTLEQHDLTLPNGDFVESGFNFRNDFHLLPQSSADFFVPCGGRPASVHINNVDRLFDEKGNPRFRFIVEGANLFFTQAARLALEKAGVIVFKDASANKGGVTSSSLEVLAALALGDDDFTAHMAVHDGVIPEFYAAYVNQVLEKIDDNATLEFECIWRENLRTRAPRSVLSDELSNEINSINDAIQRSDLNQDERLFQKVLKAACPEILVEKVGIEALLQRVPDNYLNAIFAAYLASRYVYHFGMTATPVDFVQFVKNY